VKYKNLNKNQNFTLFESNCSSVGSSSQRNKRAMKNALYISRAISTYFYTVDSHRIAKFSRKGLFFKEEEATNSINTNFERKFTDI
jgi:hypothetical protein